MRKFIETLCIDNIPADTIILDEDIALVTYNRDDYPCSPTEAYKLPHTVIGLCVEGECSFRLNMQDYNIKSPAINISSTLFFMCIHPFMLTVLQILW